MLRSSGIIESVIKVISPITKMFKFPSEIIPLCLIRPISGGASTAIATDIMTNYGVDTIIGLIAATIMGSTETTFYAISVYSSSVNIKKLRFVLVPGLIADMTSIVMAVILWSFLS